MHFRLVFNAWSWLVFSTLPNKPQNWCIVRDTWAPAGKKIKKHTQQHCLKTKWQLGLHEPSSLYTHPPEIPYSIYFRSWLMPCTLDRSGHIATITFGSPAHNALSAELLYQITQYILVLKDDPLSKPIKQWGRTYIWCRSRIWLN